MTAPAASLEYLQVPNWAHLQHYKDRAPAWIKAYPDTLDDYRFAALPDAAKGHVFAIQLLASRNDNKLPKDARWVAQRIGAQEPVDLDLLITAGFLEPYDPSSNPLAERKPTAPRGEERKEEKRRGNTRTRAREASGAAHPPTPPRGGDLEPVQTLIPLLQISDGGGDRATPLGPGYEEFKAAKESLKPPWVETA